MNKHALVTGGAQRLGAEICRRFAHAGWTVWCHHRHSGAQALALQQELADGTPGLRLVQADLADPAQRRRMMQTIADAGGPLHALVNNASLFEPDSGLDFGLAQAEAQLNVNLMAPLDLARLLAQQWRDQGNTAPPDGAPSPCVLHLLDQKVFNLNPDYFSYTVSKLALERAVALQAQALAPTLRVCGVAPGLLYLSGPQSAENFQRASRVNLMRRGTDPGDVARSCLFLAETPSITGCTLTVDNGQHLVPLQRDVMFAIDERSEP